MEAGKKMMADMNLQDNAAARGAGVASRRCERGRVPSDSSSGISDDSSSSGSGSDRDSGIETGDTGPGLGSNPVSAALGKAGFTKLGMVSSQANWH
mgnify:CR=1 FL=1